MVVDETGDDGRPERIKDKRRYIEKISILIKYKDVRLYKMKYFIHLDV